ncbi:MAG: fructose-1,6-bisphosphatase [Streptococcaceae bacterium]|jgi:fructose-1,6-bisphosphatase-3|nr:fructose-1,6-bisphosphatase [Streptococcaceae bacterium]
MGNKYYKLLKENYQTKENVLTEIINLSAICELPKGTEHFVSDLHGEFLAFDHVLRNGSGGIKEKIRECFPNFSAAEVTDLAVLIYYPKEKLIQVIADKKPENLPSWYQVVIIQLLQVLVLVGGKYTQSKIRKALPSQFSYIIEELLDEVDNEAEKKEYFASIIQKIISLGQAQALIEALANTVRRLTIDHLHVVGDIYDRGPYPDLIIDRLMTLPSVDIQWGNHDIIWMAAMAGSRLAMMNVVRICARYGNLDIIEDRYGINLRPLIDYSQKYYHPADAFAAKLDEKERLSISAHEQGILNVLQQSTAILQFKLESQLIQRRPDFGLEARDLLHRIDYDKQEIRLDDRKTYQLENFHAPTIADTAHPEKLTDEEEQLLEKLMQSFQSSEKLRRHTDFLLKKGSIYLCYNDNLLIHGCIPLHENGDFKSFRVEGHSYSGKALLDFFEQKVRESFKNPKEGKDLATDLLWYLWTGECSSLFGKAAMTTFERYYIKDKHTHIEKKNAYYQLRNDEEVVSRLLEAFGLSEEGHIINGHTPVKEKDGENPIKAGGHLIVIDGGFSKAYRKETGIAGYTLLYNSFGMLLVAHQPFKGIEDAVDKGLDIVSSVRLVDQVKHRKRVKDTNVGQKLLEDIKDLEYLYEHMDKD